jgi:hypothetical protein
VVLDQRRLKALRCHSRDDLDKVRRKIVAVRELVILDGRSATEAARLFEERGRAVAARAERAARDRAFSLAWEISFFKLEAVSP